jgi:hypothetical protein
MDFDAMDRRAFEVVPLSAYAEDFSGLREEDSPGAVKPSERFQFVPVSDLVEQLQPIDWLVKSFIERDATTCLWGAPGGGKSLVAIDIACSVASGTPWHGNRTQEGAVFVLAGEGHNGLSRRFQAWSMANAVSLDGVPLFVSRTAAALTDLQSAECVAVAVDELAEMKGVTPALIIVDTLARNFGPRDENSTADMNAFIAHIDVQLRRRWRCAVMIVHHSGKDGARGARGSTALRGAVDAEYELSRDEGGLVRLACRKMKDAEFPPPLAFTIESLQLALVDADGDPVSGPALRVAEYSESKSRPLSRDEQLGLDQLSDEWKAFQIWRDDWFFHASQVVASRGKNQGKQRSKDALRPTFQRVLKSLTEKGLIEVSRSMGGTSESVRLARPAEV